MKNFLTLSTLAMVTTIFVAPAFADGKNWSDDKRDQVDVNRNSNAGIGNGGEQAGNPNSYSAPGTWGPSTFGEDQDGLATWDRDPGNSAGNNNAASNE